MSSSSPSSCQVVAATCILLAIKCDERDVKLRDVINVSHSVLNPDAPPMAIDTVRDGGGENDTQRYNQLRDLIVTTEQVVLRGIGFQIEVQLPYLYLLNYCKLLDGMPTCMMMTVSRCMSNDDDVVGTDILQTSWTFVNDRYVHSSSSPPSCQLLLTAMCSCCPACSCSWCSVSSYEVC